MDVLRYDAVFVDWHLGYIVDDIDTLALTRILRLDDPIIRQILAFEIVKMTVKVSELIRQDVAIWDEVELILAVLLLHLDDIRDEAVFARQLIREWVVIDLLKFL